MGTPRTLRQLRIGTRGSQLALWQAHAVQSRIAVAGGPPCSIVVIKTSGDRLQERPLSEVGGKRLFVKEIEDALLNDEVDLAVHSSKDLPGVLPDGLTISAVLPREDPHDAVVLPERSSGHAGASPATLEELIAALGEHPAIATGSIRRVAQLRRVMPRARFVPIRGNIDTRLRKLDAGEHDAIVLAAAGLRRLGFGHRISWTLTESVCVPAPGQGIVAVETRDNDAVQSAVSAIDDRSAHAALTAERAVVNALGGDCQTPIGAYAKVTEGGELDLVAVVVSPDGARLIRVTRRGGTDSAGALGGEAGRQLMADGAAEILGMR